MDQEQQPGATPARTPGQVLHDNIKIVLVRPQQSGNVGGVARAMKNTGLRHLCVVAPPALDIDRARWMAPGSHDILDALQVARTVQEAIADCNLVVATTARVRQWRWPAYDLDSFAAVPFEESGKVAILFGPEDSGLNNKDLAYAHAILSIATDAHFSLNLSQAVLLTTYTLFGEARRRGYYPVLDGVGRRGGARAGPYVGTPPEEPPATIGDIEPLIGRWMENLETAGYLRGHEPVLVESTLRRILRKASLTFQESIVLRGMMAKFRWRMANPGPLPSKHEAKNKQG